VKATQEYLYDQELQANTELDSGDLRLCFEKFHEFFELPDEIATKELFIDKDEFWIRRGFLHVNQEDNLLLSELSRIEMTYWTHEIYGHEQDEFWFDITTGSNTMPTKFTSHYRFTKYAYGLVDAYVEQTDVSGGTQWDRRKMTQYDLDQLFLEMMDLSSKVDQIVQ